MFTGPSSASSTQRITVRPIDNTLRCFIFIFTSTTFAHSPISIILRVVTSSIDSNRPSVPFAEDLRVLGRHKSAPKRLLDRFSRFCRVHDLDQRAHTYTNTQTVHAAALARPRALFSAAQRRTPRRASADLESGLDSRLSATFVW